MSSQPQLLEKPISSATKFCGSFLQVMEDTIELPNGKTAKREYIKHPGAVAIIAITDQNEIILEYQYRHPIGQVMLELPAGKLDKNEASLTAAKRELHEETGYSASHWVKLGACFPCIAYSTEQIVYYLAQNLQSGKAQLDEGEFVEITLMPLAQCMQLAYTGQITDSKTLAGLMLYQGYLLKK